MTQLRRHQLVAIAIAASLSAATLPAWAAKEGSGNTAAREALAKGDTRTALIHLKNAVRDNPKNGAARFELAELLYKLGDFASAEKDLRHAREAGYDPARVLPALGQTFLAQRKFQQLLDEITDCSVDAVCRSRVQAARARAWLGLGKLDGADAESKAALSAAPTPPTDVQLARAAVLIGGNALDEADKMIDAVLLTQPGHGDALSYKGEIRRLRGDYDGAIQAFDAAILTNPRDVVSRERLAVLLLGKNSDADAREHVDMLLRTSPAAIFPRYLGAMLDVRAGNHAKALEAVRSVEAGIGKLPNGHYLLAVIHAANGNIEQARDLADRFLANNPDSVAAATLAGRLAFRRGDNARVIALLAPMRERLAGNAADLGLLGSAYLSQGRTAEAQEVLAAAARLQPDNTMSQTRLAVSRLQRSDTRDTGIRELEGILDKDPRNSPAGMALLFSYIGKGDLAAAVATAREQAAAHPDLPLPRIVLGTALLLSGDPGAARAVFQEAADRFPEFPSAFTNLAELDARMGKFDAARTTLDALLQRKPQEAGALLARAKLESDTGSPTSAVPFLERATAAAPDDLAVRARLIEGLLAAGHPDRAIAIARDIAKQHAKNPTALDMAASALLATGKQDEALGLYRQTLKLAPSSARLHHRVAQVMMRVGHTADAKVELDKAVELESGLLAAWRDRIELERRASGVEAAKMVAEKARRAMPDSAPAALLSGDLMAAAGKPTEAEAAYRKAFEQSPSSEAAQRLFRVTTDKGDRVRARKQITEWLKQHPDDHDSRMLLAEDLLAGGDFKSAVKHYETLAARLPLSAAVMNNLAWTYDKLGDPRAAPTANRAFAPAPASPEIIDTYAWLLYRQGDRTTAPDLLARAYKAAPRAPAMAYHRATAMADAGDVAGARAVLKPIIEAKAEFDEASQARALWTRLGGI